MDEISMLGSKDGPLATGGTVKNDDIYQRDGDREDTILIYWHKIIDDIIMHV